MKQDLHGAATAPSVKPAARTHRAAARKAVFRRGILVGLCAALGACASIVPGDRAYSLRDEQSAVKLPVKAGDAAEPVPANVAIKPITAELIIEQLKVADPQKPTATSAKDSASVMVTASPSQSMPKSSANSGVKNTNTEILVAG